MRGSVGVVGWLMVGGVAALGQGSTLPAASPTSPIVAAAPRGESAVAGATPVAQDGAKRARVTWLGGQLTIAAENSSINQILREVSRTTGMKVTGGVADERVYGSYGPGTPEEVLERLLTGTGTNMQLKASAENVPLELVLSPRKGGATPPGPASYGGGRDDREDDLPPQQVLPSSRLGNVAGRPVYPDTPAAANVRGTPGATQTGSDAAVPAPVPTDVQSPNGVKTPQQIYDQLMQLQKQKAAQTPPL